MNLLKANICFLSITLGLSTAKGCERVQKVDCAEIKTSTGYKFRHNFLLGTKKSVYHPGDKTIAHIGYELKPDYNRTYVVSIDERAVVTHNCTDLEIQSSGDDVGTARDCVSYRTESKPTNLPNGGGGTAKPQGGGSGGVGHVGGHVGGGVDGGGGGSGGGGDDGGSVGRVGLAIGLPVVGVVLLLLLGFCIWKKYPEPFHWLRERLTCRAPGTSIPLNTVVSEGTARAALGGAVLGGSAVKGGGVSGGCVCPGEAVPAGEAEGPDRVLDPKDEEEAVRVPLFCDNPEVVVTVDVPDSEPDQDPDGTSCGVPLSGVEAAQQEELKNHD